MGAFGDIAEGNVGEFMKYLPSVTADFAASSGLPCVIQWLKIKFRSVHSAASTPALVRNERRESKALR